jgi:hypothetical protein
MASPELSRRAEKVVGYTPLTRESLCTGLVRKTTAKCGSEGRK